MKKILTVEGLMNEMSYDLKMEELENVIVDYQDVVIEFFVNNAYNYKKRKELYAISDLIRSDKYFKTLALMINGEDLRINPDMSYVLHIATNFKSVDDETKGEALQLGYMLRERELGMITENEKLNICILIASTKVFRSYQSTPFIRTKFIENILSTLPSVLYNAFGEDNAKKLSVKVIYKILTEAVIDLRPEEVTAAFCKSQFPNDVTEGIREYALRLRAFFYEVCGALSDEVLTKMLLTASNALIKFNERHNTNETFTDKYLNYGLIEAIVKRNPEGKGAMLDSIRRTYKAIKMFKNKNEKYDQLF